MRILSRLARTWAAASALLAALCVLPASAAWAGAFSLSAHGNSATLPRECGSCHVGHGTPQTTMFRTSEEATCLQCHSDSGTKSAAQAKGLIRGTGNPVNIAAEFSKPSPHPLAGFTHPTAPALLTTTPRAGPPPVLLAAPPTSSASSSVVSCSSCHDPHYLVKPSVSATAAITGTITPKQTSNSRGARQPEYKICYNCHGSGGAQNIQRLMRPSNPSYHPLEAPGRNPVVPSLIQPYVSQSYVACTDCHGSDDANVRGPHGSAFHPILKASFTQQDYQAESAFEYQLCYNCHNRSLVLSGASSFPLHSLHVVNAKTSCHTCHDSHGSELFEHLINFNPTLVFGNSKGQIFYQPLGPQHGACNLLCHGHDHVQKKY